MAAGTDIAQIVKDHYDRVFWFCARRVGADRAEDAAQETFLTAQRGIARYKGRSALSTWLLGIANNHCRHLARSRRLAPPMIELDESTGPLVGDEEYLINRHALQQALNALTPEHREAVILHELDGLSYEEAATLLGVPPGTVKSRVHHAFLNLRTALEESPAPANGAQR